MEEVKTCPNCGWDFTIPLQVGQTVKLNTDPPTAGFVMSVDKTHGQVKLLIPGADENVIAMRKIEEFQTIMQHVRRDHSSDAASEAN